MLIGNQFESICQFAVIRLRFLVRATRRVRSLHAGKRPRLLQRIKDNIVKLPPLFALFWPLLHLPESVVRTLARLGITTESVKVVGRPSAGFGWKAETCEPR